MSVASRCLLRWRGTAAQRVLYTTRVTYRGQPTPTSFLLKGAGLKGMLTPARLGKTGDQLTWMLRQPADLFIVQHIGAVSPAVRQQLQDAVVARRAHGHTVAVGSVWDGGHRAAVRRPRLHRAPHPQGTTWHLQGLIRHSCHSTWLHAQRASVRTSSLFCSTSNGCRLLYSWWGSPDLLLPLSVFG